MIRKMTQKSFATGSSCPSLAAGRWRIYSMRFCPFSQRTRLVLAHKGISHDTVNIHLRQKPEWFLEKNPMGLVPVVEKDGRCISESGICNDYLEEMYPDPPLYPKDPYVKARQRQLMERYGKVISAHYGILRASDEDTKSEKLQELHSQLNSWETELTEDYFGGANVGMIDYHFWPWIERWGALSAMVDRDLLPSAKYPKLSAWQGRMLTNKAVATTMFNDQTYRHYMESYLAGNPDHDFELTD